MGTLNTSFCPAEFNSSVNMIAYDRRQNRGKSNKGKQSGGKNGAQNKSRGRTLHFLINLLENPRYGRKVYEVCKPEHSQGQKCAAKNAKCKVATRLGIFTRYVNPRRRPGEPT